MKKISWSMRKGVYCYQDQNNIVGLYYMLVFNNYLLIVENILEIVKNLFKKELKKIQNWSVG